MSEQRPVSPSRPAVSYQHGYRIEDKGSGRLVLAHGFKTSLPAIENTATAPAEARHDISAQTAAVLEDVAAAETTEQKPFHFTHDPLNSAYWKQVAVAEPTSSTEQLDDSLPLPAEAPTPVANVPKTEPVALSPTVSLDYRLVDVNARKKDTGVYTSPELYQRSDTDSMRAAAVDNWFNRHTGSVRNAIGSAALVAAGLTLVAAQAAPERSQQAHRSADITPVEQPVSIPTTVPEVPSTTTTAAPEKKEPYTSQIPWLPETVKAWAPEIEAASQRYGVDPNLIEIIMVQESAGNPTVTSPADAKGLMQLWPPTAMQIALARGETATPDMHDPVANLDYGVYHLRQIIEERGFDGQELTPEMVGEIAANYNGGPVQASALANNLPMIEETQNYARRAAGMWAAREQPDSPAYDEWHAIAEGKHEFVTGAVKALVELQRLPAELLPPPTTTTTEAPPPLSPYLEGNEAMLKNVSPRVAEIVRQLDEKHVFRISSAYRRTSTLHGSGHAVDFSGVTGINGQTFGYGGHHDEVQQFINAAAGLMPKGTKCEIGVPNASYIPQPKEIAPQCSVFVDNPQTTGSSGPHVHLGARF